MLPCTRSWVTSGFSGVPVGTQVAVLSVSSAGEPSISTRVAPTIHCAVTQGPPAFGGSAQPATV